MAFSMTVESSSISGFNGGTPLNVAELFNYTSTNPNFEKARPEVINRAAIGERFSSCEAKHVQNISTPCNKPTNETQRT